MSSLYYTREPGADGGIVSGEGEAPGVSLDQLIERDRPPLRAAMEIGSAVADILCISTEDKQVHGDIRPAHVKITEDGAVSIEGFGTSRRKSQAPEGRADIVAADIYGLGLVLHAALSKEGIGTLPADADGHDDAVVERVLGMDFSAVAGKRWLAEAREFLCKILAFEPDERPLPLDAANVLYTVASQSPGDSVADWAKRAHTRLAGGRPPARPVSEQLAGPVSVAGYFKGAQKDAARKAPSSKGESTAMWSREKLAAMFADEDSEEAPVPRRADSTAAPRRPEPSAAPLPAAPPKAPPPAPPAGGYSTAPRPMVERAEPPKPQRVEPDRPAPRPEPRNERPEPRGYTPPIVASPPREEPAPSGGSNTLLIVVVGLVIIALVCTGFSVLGGGGYFMLKGGEAPTAETSPRADAKPGEAKPAETVMASEDKPVETPKPIEPQAGQAKPKPATTASAGSGSTPSTKPTPAKPAATEPATTPATTPAPAPTPASTTTSTSTFPVKFSSPGREGKIRCGDGQTVEFTGATTLNFSGTTTCLVQIGQGRGAVQVSRSSTVTCSEDSGKVSCSGGS